jgi:hypothetical protein
MKIYSNKKHSFNIHSVIHLSGKYSWRLILLKKLNKLYDLVAMVKY